MEEEGFDKYSGAVLTLAAWPELRKDLEKLANIDFPDDVVNHQPLGDKLIVVLEEVPEQTKGGIVRPEVTRIAERGGSGWIIAVGHLVGQGPPASCGYLSWATGATDPTTYLGLKVMFTKYTPVTIRAFDRDDDFNSRFVCMRELDLHTIQLNRG